MGLLNSPRELIEDFYSALGMTQEELAEVTADAYAEIEANIDVQPEMANFSFPLTYKTVGDVLIFTGCLNWDTDEDEVFSRDDVLNLPGDTALLMLQSQIQIFG